MTEPDHSGGERYARRRQAIRWNSRRLWWSVAAATLLVAGGYWLLMRGRVATDNARIEGPVHAISARVEGEVVEVLVDLHQHVEQGEALFRIDPRDFELAHSRAEAELASADAEVEVATSDVPVGSTEATSYQTQARAQEDNAATEVNAAARGERLAAARLRAAQAALGQAKAHASRAADDLARLEPLAAKKQIATQEVEGARAEAAGAAALVEQQQALVDAASEELEISRSHSSISAGALQQARAARASADTAPSKVAAVMARAGLAEARLQEAQAALDRARLDLEDTTVRAPVSGIVGRKNVEVGQMVRRGQAVMAIVGHDVWVEANFKETQVRDMIPGQRATVRVDAYPGSFSGVVHSIGPATGSRFSLLPADNTSGNFVKVVQRVPVKIVFDERELARHEDVDGGHRPLRPGMSVDVSVELDRP